jgi:xanthine dehydrogenase YagS FAD-binding subunit
VRSRADGIEIGAMTTLTEVAEHPLILEKYRVLAEAAEAVASPQIRNQATIGGNVSQDARCWYYRAGWPCYRAGGNLCYADTPDGRNREHAIALAVSCKESPYVLQRKVYQPEKITLLQRLAPFPYLKNSRWFTQIV